MASPTVSLFDPQIAIAFKAAQSLPRLSRGWAVMRPCRPVLLRHGLQVMGVCVLICVLLWALRPGVPFLGQLAYSLPMGLTTWLLIDGGRFFFDQDSPHLFPRGWRGGLLILSGVFLGFLAGTLIGGMLNGQSNFDQLRRAPEFFAYIFLFSMASGIGISLFFYAQGKSAYLQAEIEAQKRQATDAQLKLLQSQLDPHMLFNTLANLRVLIQSEPDRAVQMLDQLNDFLRATLSASRASEHSLQAEFDRLRDYLALMQIRMGARLRYKLDLPPNLASARVPALIMQSLVENAVLHGLEPKVQGGQITVCAAQEGNMLVLTVQDDGLGFDAGFRDQFGKAAQPEGFGLTQVRERLKSRYGENATIELIAHCAHSIKGSGLKGSENSALNDAPGCLVTLCIPLPA
jgi:hypothetical protein